MERTDGVINPHNFDFNYFELRMERVDGVTNPHSFNFFQLELLIFLGMERADGVTIHHNFISNFLVVFALSHGEGCWRHYSTHNFNFNS